MGDQGALTLVAGEHGSRSAPGDVQHLPWQPVVFGLARRSLPHLVEATVAPTMLFYVLLVTISSRAAMVGVLCWTFVAVTRRLARGRALPAILLLTTVGLSVRTVIALVSGSTFAYFVQPIATTVVLAAVFGGSVLIGRPVVARFASDFCEFTPEIGGRPRVVRLFRGLTLLWAGVHVVTSVATFALLVSLPTATYVLLKTVACLSITVAAIALTVSCSIRTARNEGLVFATAPV
ncbi:MAG TPA: VC0807 family protein [Acidimicrobiia bacterium]